mmetsp:Transcript_40984/g.67380  ORF Transcript_40984/g.67380 Transcript_40984/m.67380 type:complete len:237 (+) Transcript_40984:655-1365(+)
MPILCADLTRCIPSECVRDECDRSRKYSPSAVVEALGDSGALEGISGGGGCTCSVLNEADFQSCVVLPPLAAAALRACDASAAVYGDGGKQKLFDFGSVLVVAACSRFSADVLPASPPPPPPPPSMCFISSLPVCSLFLPRDGCNEYTSSSSSNVKPLKISFVRGDASANMSSVNPCFIPGTSSASRFISISVSILLIDKVLVSPPVSDNFLLSVCSSLAAPFFRLELTLLLLLPW